MLAEILSSLRSLSTKMDALDAKVDALDAKVDALDAKVDELSTKSMDIETKLDSVDYRVRAVEKHVGCLTEESARQRYQSEFGSNFTKGFMLHGLSSFAHFITPRSERKCPDGQAKVIQIGA